MTHLRLLTDERKPASLRERLAAAIDEGRMADARILQSRFYAMIRAKQQERRTWEADTHAD